MLEVKKLTVCYNDFLALNEISLKIQEGALTGIIGPNGAGKSTLLKAMLNIIPHREMSPLIMKTSIKNW